MITRDKAVIISMILQLNITQHYPPKTGFFFSFYKGRDKYENNTNFIYDYKDEFEETYLFYDNYQALDWGNTIGALRWNHLYSDQLFSNTTLTFSNYQYNSFNELIDDTIFDLDTFYYHYANQFRSAIRDIRLKLDFDYYPSHRHHLQFGAHALLRRFEPGSFELTIEEDSLTASSVSGYIDNLYSTSTYQTDEYNLYLQDHIQWDDHWSMMLGLHGAVFFTDQATYTSVQPRLGLYYQASNKLGVRFSMTRMTQFLHLLTTSGAGLPTDLWVPSTRLVKPQHAWQYALSIQSDRNKLLHGSLSVYHKTMKGLISYAADASLPSLFEIDPYYWEEDILAGSGKAYGIEAVLQKTEGRTKGAVSYNYSRSERKFVGLNDGNPYPFRYERPHAIKLHIAQQFGKYLSFQLAWQFSSGQPITLLASEYQFEPLDNTFPAPDQQRSGINAYVLPAYHRLDINLCIRWSKAAFAHQINLGVYNAYNRKNPFYVYILEDEFFPEDSGLKQQNALPILPSISYRVSFKKVLNNE